MSRHPNDFSIAPTSTVDEEITTSTELTNTRTILTGRNHGGLFTDVPVTSDGHLKVSIEDPKAAFGEIKVASVNPLFQASFGYGLNSMQFDMWTVSGGTTSTSNGLLTLSTDGTSGSKARVTSKRRIHTRPGQGAIIRFTGLFSEGVANSRMIIGPITTEAGWAFGRNGTSFGILYRKGGQRNIRTLTVSNGANGTEQLTITLDSSTLTFTPTSGNATHTAYQIAQQNYSSTNSGWDAAQVGATVIFICREARVTTGTFSMATNSGGGGSAAGTFANTTPGVAPTDTWIPQETWFDPMDGTGPSVNTIIPSNGNIFEINYQDMGFGPVFFRIEHQTLNARDTSRETVYTLNNSNQTATPGVKNSSMPWTMEVQNLASSTPISIGASACMIGVDGSDSAGIEMPTIIGSSSTIGTTEHPLLSIRNGYTFGGTQTNNAGIKITHITFSIKGVNNSIVTIRARRNATLTGATSFSEAFSGISAANVDTGSTGLSGGTLLLSQSYVETASIREDYGSKGYLYVGPGETITFSAQASTGSTSIVSLNIEYLEYQ
jgi:hypothetical protein